jgi:4-aminobutyrate aminotransferase/(S)-3-amino-2-methylpropionate transaminase
MIGIEFVIAGDPKKPASDLVAKITGKCRDEGLLILTAGTYKNVIRILAPLIIEDADLNRGLEILEEAIAAAV